MWDKKKKRKKEDKGIVDRKNVEKRDKIMRKKIDSIRCIEDIGKEVEEIVIKEGGEIMKEKREKIVKDEKIG